MIRVARWGIVAGVVVATACTGDLLGIEHFVSVEAFEPRLGVRSERRRMILSGTFAIQNGSPRPIGIDACSQRFERLESDGWRGVTSVLCALGGADLIWVGPGDVYGFKDYEDSAPIGDGPLAGEYRFSVEVVDVVDGKLVFRRINSEPFTLEPVEL